jgi:hypothetical protein
LEGGASATLLHSHHELSDTSTLPMHYCHHGLNPLTAQLTGYNVLFQ